MTLSQELAEGLAIANYFDYESGARGRVELPTKGLWVLCSTTELPWQKEG